MDSPNQENTHQVSDQSVGENPQTCPNCRQTYMFDVECPTCKAHVSEDTEKLIVAVHIKNLTDHMGVIDFYEASLDKLKAIDKLVTQIFKEKEPNNG